jgi:hypothetical protein
MTLLYQFLPIVSVAMATFGFPAALAFILRRRTGLRHRLILFLPSLPFSLVAGYAWAAMMAVGNGAAVGQSGVFAVGLFLVGLFATALFYSAGVAWAALGIRLAEQRPLTPGESGKAK